MFGAPTPYLFQPRGCVQRKTLGNCHPGCNVTAKETLVYEGKVGALREREAIVLWVHDREGKLGIATSALQALENQTFESSEIPQQMTQEY